MRIILDVFISVPIRNRALKVVQITLLNNINWHKKELSPIAKKNPNKYIK